MDGVRDLVCRYARGVLELLRCAIGLRRFSHCPAESGSSLWRIQLGSTHGSICFVPHLHFELHLVAPGGLELSPRQFRVAPSKWFLYFCAGRTTFQAHRQQPSAITSVCGPGCCFLPCSSGPDRVCDVYIESFRVTIHIFLPPRFPYLPFVAGKAHWLSVQSSRGNTLLLRTWIQRNRHYSTRDDFSIRFPLLVEG